MKNIEFEEGRAEIRLNKKIYPEESINKTVSIFSNGFEVETERTGKETIVKIASEDTDIEKVGYRFLNYLLSEIRRKDSSKVNI
ncbi:MAG: HxsD-like protein [Candidatus Aenigmatarchaeota archaeon]